MASFIVEKIAVEEFGPGISCRADVTDRLLHVAEGAIGELDDGGDADGIAAERTPAIGMIGQFHRHLVSSHA